MAWKTYQIWDGDIQEIIVVHIHGSLDGLEKMSAIIRKGLFKDKKLEDMES